MLQFLQRIGKAVMLPIAALPIAGILLGVGGAFLGIAGLENAPAIYQPLLAFISIPAVHAVLTVMKNIGDIVFGNLPVLFAVGVAVGLAKKDKGTAALAAVFGFFCCIWFLSNEPNNFFTFSFRSYSIRRINT